MQIRIQTTIAAIANIPTTAPTPIPAFVPFVMFDMMRVLQISECGSSQGRWEVKPRIDDGSGAGRVDGDTLPDTEPVDGA